MIQFYMKKLKSEHDALFSIEKNLYLIINILQIRPKYSTKLRIKPSKINSLKKKILNKISVNI